MTKGIFFTLIICITAAYTYAQSPGEGWSFTYGGDEFTSDALLDLSFLNEELAGENGFIRLSADSNYFVNDKGEIRFWSINGGTLIRGHDPELTDADLKIYAKFLAKMGVNMIRYHGEMFSTTQDINKPNQEEADYIWRVVAAMKEEGIYTTISPFWPAHIENIPRNWDLGDYVGEIDPWGLIYFNQHFRDAYKNWVEYLYTEVNPYTGIALKDDPAVGLIQILNEDGVFFWTIGGVQPSLNQEMQEQFFEWAETRYGSAQDALSAWENTSLPEDDINQGLFEMINIWYATDDPNVPTPTTGFDKRLSDQMSFFAEVQRSAYEEIYVHYRAMGCKQLINTTNWKTASPNKLFDLERWTNLAGDVLAVNRYYAPGHIGENSGWRIENDHYYVGNSAMNYPGLLPINIKQVKGRPFIVTESGWNLPHKFQAEGPFLVSAYMSLTGVDSYYWFSPSATTYDEDPYFPYWGEINGSEPMFRWTISTPGQIAMFPANALAFRRGYISEGSVVLHEERTFQSLIRRETPLISEDNSFDPNRDIFNPNPPEGETAYSSLTYLIGPVEVEYEGDPSDNVISPELDDLINSNDKTVSSNTGELFWDYDQGICLLDAPKIQGICGFPEEDPYSLSDVSITSKNDYAVVSIISMDDLPISESEKILIQVGTVYRPTGWEETATKFAPTEGAEEVDGFRIDNVGEMPWKAAKTMVKVDIRNKNVKSAWLLNSAGYEDRETVVTETAEGLSLWLPQSAMYVILDTRPSSRPAGLIDEPDNKIKVFPNPNKGNFRIGFSEAEFPEKIHTLTVLDIHGKPVKSFDYRREAIYSLEVPFGVYFIKLYTEEGNSITKKLIME